jgi:sugar phosphate isomerase/epimerase
MGFKLSLAIQTPEVEPVLPVALLTGTLTEKLAKAAEYGADGVELMTIKPGELDAAEIRRQVSARGLEVSAVASGGMAFAAGLTLLHTDPLRASQARNRLTMLIDFAAAVGAPLVTIGSFRGRVATLAGQGQDILAQLLDQAGNLAERKGVRLVIEPLNRYETDFLHNTAEGLAFIKKIGNPNLGLLLDTYHANIEESSRAEPFREASTAGRLWHVHIADNNRLPPGKGLIDFKTILSMLKECGYTGFLSAELLAQPDPDEAARQTVQAMRLLMEE